MHQVLKQWLKQKLHGGGMRMHAVKTLGLSEEKGIPLVQDWL